jgi:hypothetical protein
MVRYLYVLLVLLPEGVGVAGQDEELHLPGRRDDRPRVLGVPGLDIAGLQDLQ